jgi:hypothetical protein
MLRGSSKARLKQLSFSSKFSAAKNAEKLPRYIVINIGFL